MSDLLTRDEYAALAKDIDFPRAAFVDGGFRVGQGPRSPATGEALAEITMANDISILLSKWNKLHGAERRLIRRKLMTTFQRQTHFRLRTGRHPRSD